MTKFKIGDKFIPRKPEYLWNYHRHWKERMERCWNRMMTIDELHLISDDRIYLVSEGTSFNADWCEKVDQSAETNEMVEEHISKASKTIDWEQRRYEIAKECLAAQIAEISWDDSAMVKYSINAADELIKQLRETQES